MPKLNIAYPATGMQKVINVEDEREIHPFLDKRISAIVPGDSLGEAYQGYEFKITGGYDKQGFAMKQGVLVNHRVRLLLGEGMGQFRPRRSGQKRRKSIRGCITSADMSMINLTVVKKGASELAGVTDGYQPRRLGPKRASNIRKLFNLSKEDDVRKYVIRRTLPPTKKQQAKLDEIEDEDAKKKAAEGLKKRSRAPKIQRLVTPLNLQRKRHMVSLKARNAAARKQEKQQYEKLLVERAAARRESALSSRRSQIASQKEEKKAVETKKPETKKAPAKEEKKAAAAPAAAKKAAEPKKAAAPAAAKKAAAPAAAKKADAKKSGKK